MRGKPLFFLCFMPFPRITPACAGKTLMKKRWNCSRKDHPRVCGENQPCLFRLCPLKGSPPRVRGKRIGIQTMRLRFGITPACAGKTPPRFLIKLLHWDHPRVCGENSIQHSNSPFMVGSPPRVRGKQHSPVRTLMFTGITPACAGKTWKHPRLYSCS